MIQPIVEGHGEVQAVPVLLRRLIPEHGCYMDIGTAPIRQRRAEIVREHEPEAKRGAKGILNGFMPSTAPYSETADQPALSATFDLAQAYRRAASFRKFVKELCHVLTQLGQQPGIPEGWTS